MALAILLTLLTHPRCQWFKKTKADGAQFPKSDLETTKYFKTNNY